MHVQRPDRTIQGTGAALHAAIPVDDLGFPAIHPENRMRADIGALAAAGAQAGVIG